MYIPRAFRIDDFNKLTGFIQDHCFATLVTVCDSVPFASHLPMLFCPTAGCHGTLISHMARANPQWEHFQTGGESLAIFHGPHTYISPTWYQTTHEVPTWNYATVHAYGIPKVLSEHEAVVRVLRDTIAMFEASREQPWPGDLPDDFRDELIRCIVAFEIPISRMEGKFKLSQNRSAVDQQGVVTALSQSGDVQCHKVAVMMAAECEGAKQCRREVT